MEKSLRRSCSCGELLIICRVYASMNIGNMVQHKTLKAHTTVVFNGWTCDILTVTKNIVFILFYLKIKKLFDILFELKSYDALSINDNRFRSQFARKCWKSGWTI